MPKVNRDRFEDAKQVVEQLLPDSAARQKFNNFLLDAFSYAEVIKSNNWNLNLDKNGKFLRFNVGEEYCIQLTDDELLILCDRTTLHLIPDLKAIPLVFRGHKKKQCIEDIDIQKVPDCVAKTKNSIGCVLKLEFIDGHIHKFKSSNQDFIRAALKTKLRLNMKLAHSKGAVEYIQSQFIDSVEPLLPSLSDLLQEEAFNLERAKRLNQKERLEVLRKAAKKPVQVVVQQTVFKRNQVVVVEVLARANGFCQHCKRPAPFLKDSDNSPYLEVHHIERLADGGDDTVENAIALCPNCHRKAHYGQMDKT